MTEGSANETTKRANADYGWAMMVLGALLSASSVISLIQHGFHFQLNWGFEHFVAFYRGIITPVMDVALWPVRAALSSFHLDWTIPQWLKDFWALSFLSAGMCIRAWLAGDPGTQGKPVVATLVFLLLVFPVGATGIGLLWLLLVVPPWRPPPETSSWPTFLVAFFAAVAAASSVFGAQMYDPENRRVRRLALTAALAVIVFYVSNAIAPQLGFG